MIPRPERVALGVNGCWFVWFAVGHPAGGRTLKLVMVDKFGNGVELL